MFEFFKKRGIVLVPTERVLLALWALLLSLDLGSVGEARTLTLEEYLNQVRSSNQSMKSANATIEATRQREYSSDLNTTPQVFGQVARSVDEKPPSSPLSGDKMEALSYSLGVQKAWSFGLQSQLTYNLSKIDIERENFPPFLAPGVVNPLVGLNDDSTKHWSEGRAQLDLVQPLWKNWMGREYDLTRETTQAKLSAQRQGEQYKVKALLAQAEFIYWQLALATDAVRTQESALVRFQKIRDWVKNRVNMSLADRADLLQAEAGLKARRFELELTVRDRVSLQRTFNSLRSQQGDRLEADVMPISSRMLSDMTMAAGAIKRLDIEVARSLEKVAASEVEQWREKFKPEVSVFGSYATNSRDESFGTAATDAFKADKPSMVIGVKFSTPLDRDLINRERSGLVKASEAARLDREQKEFNARQEWEDLVRQLSDAKTRLHLATEIESAQKQKLEYEKNRLERGRTTTYQILLFEQDYSSAQLGTIKAKADILGIIAKLKSFGDAA
ncbi:MAG TPA: TolC family protein [Oligoflexus sp.]|uniref:TolC family protein n=1 Tax=Oligoflexus sp. TaxID=1971216 RepID=UPI002D3129C2|nr:TolC family protein [Oligoflexus sp.]HYX36651.1 TolC family protein [Oligoflexus sp.]